MDGQSIYRKIEVPEAYKQGTMGSVLFGKASQSLEGKAHKYMQARADYLTAMDCGASSRKGMVTCLRTERKTAEAYADWARALRASGKADSERAAANGVPELCDQRIATIDATLSGIED